MGSSVKIKERLNTEIRREEHREIDREKEREHPENSEIDELKRTRVYMKYRFYLLATKRIGFFFFFFVGMSKRSSLPFFIRMPRDGREGGISRLLRPLTACTRARAGKHVSLIKPHCEKSETGVGGSLLSNAPQNKGSCIVNISNYLVAVTAITAAVTYYYGYYVGANKRVRMVTSAELDSSLTVRAGGRGRRREREGRGAKKDDRDGARGL